MQALAGSLGSAEPRPRALGPSAETELGRAGSAGRKPRLLGTLETPGSAFPTLFEMPHLFLRQTLQSYPDRGSVFTGLSQHIKPRIDCFTEGS